MFGLYAPGHEVSRLSYFALYALQHRGQESAGIAAADRGGHIITRRELGLVSQVFTENDLRTLARRAGDRPRALLDHRLQRLGELAAGAALRGHQRLPPRGRARAQRQPHQRASSCTTSCSSAGVTFSSTSDSEIIAAMIATHPAELVEDAIADVLPRLRGAFSIVAMTKDRVVAFRDPHGLRPLAIGVLESARALDGAAGVADGSRYCVASESCAFDIIGAKFVRDVRAGRARHARRGRPAEPHGRAGRRGARSACSSTSTSRARTRA